MDVTIRSAPARDAMKKLVVERMPRLIIIDIITSEFPSVPKEIASILAMVNPMTTVKGLLRDWRDSLELLVKFFSSTVLLSEQFMFRQPCQTRFESPEVACVFCCFTSTGTANNDFFEYYELPCGAAA